ncbi:MAG TPA: hypothetical protein VMR70_01090 [Flavisolibacter sp.]|nr:hypothetical protein [Flavisolibacter sp.]
MFSQISWGEYIQTVLILFCIYYGVVLFKFYRRDILVFAKRQGAGQPFGKKENGNESALQLDLFSGGSTANSSVAMDLDPALQAFLSEVEAFLLQAGENAFDKEQILSSLQVLIERHPVSQSATYRPMVNEAIVRISQERCAFSLSEQDVASCW